jgi:hypothetical protein
VSTSDTPERWSWPAGRAITLYHWSWFDPAVGDVIVGWSQRGELDERSYVHLEAENPQQARSLEVDPDLDPIVKAQTFSGFSRLPGELRDDEGTPLPWIRALLGAD